MSETPSALNTALAKELLPRWIDNPTCPIDRPYSRRLVSADECRPAVALALQSKDDSAALEIARLRAAQYAFESWARLAFLWGDKPARAGEVDQYRVAYHKWLAALQTDGGKL